MQVVCEERTLAEKMPRHLPAGTSVGHFVDERLMREGPEHCDLCHLWAAVPRLYEKAG